MRVLESNFAGYITQTLLDIKKGCYDAFKNGDVILRLPNTIQFQAEVVCASTYNTITRTSVRTPATTQSDDISLGGSDTTVTDTSYTEYSYVTP